MRYGLPREENPKKKWKTTIEDELRCLKMEVFFLKDCLDTTNKKLAEFTSSKPPDPFAFIQGFSRSPKDENPMCQFSGSLSNEMPSPFASNFNEDKNIRFVEISNPQSTQKNPFASLCTERPRYQSTWDYDTTTKRAVRYDSITCMPSYKDSKSFEELRFEDYVLKGIGFSNQIQRYKDSMLRSSRTERNNISFSQKTVKALEKKKSEDYSKNPMGPLMIPWYITPKIPKAPWPFGPSSRKTEISSSSASNKITTDKSFKFDIQVNQNKPVPVFNFQSNTETKNDSDIRITAQDEKLSSQVLFELRKMGEKMSSINDQLSKVDSNLSEVSSRVSVMDSRLSAVDMFVTMQRFDKTWQGLETKLAGIKTPSPATVMNLPVEKPINVDSIQPLVNNNTTLVKNEKEKEKVNSCSSGSEKSDINLISNLETTSPGTSAKNEVVNSSAMDTSDMNLSDFVRSISCTDMSSESKSIYTLSSCNHSGVSETSFKIKPEISSIEMADLKSVSLPPESSLTKNSSLQRNESITNHSGSMLSISSDIEISTEIKNDNEEIQAKCSVEFSENAGTHHGTTPAHEIESPVNSVDNGNKNGKISSDPLGVSQVKDLSSSPDDISVNEIENDAENEFVMVEKSDIEESEETSKSKSLYSSRKSHKDETASNSEFKMYNDITEYLEINLGKKKNLVYEFGFEAKPDYFIESEGNSSCVPEGNRGEATSLDDSFQLFKANFTENKLVDDKQSSPFVLFDSKTPKESSGEKHQNHQNNDEQR